MPTDRPRHRRTLMWASIALAVVVVGVVALRVADVTGPQSCPRCHSGNGFAVATQASSHGTVACRDCHLSRGLLGEAVFAAQQPLHTVLALNRAANRDSASVPDERCTRCHRAVLKGVASDGDIRIDHSFCAKGTACTTCHSSVAHGSATSWVRSYDMDVCLACHVSSKNVSCDLCHEDRESTERASFASFAVTHGPKWKATHGMGDQAACTVCHHAKDCVKCHGVGVPHEPKFIEVHASYASRPGAKCSSCHPKRFCDACHGTKMPHPASFTRTHPASAKKQGELCKQCHVASDCTGCHVKHVHPGGAIGTASAGGES